MGFEGFFFSARVVWKSRQGMGIDGVLIHRMEKGMGFRQSD